MSKIDQEIEQVAEVMAKSAEVSAASRETLAKTIRVLGPEGIRKAIPALSGEQKTLLADVLEEMRKSAYSPEPLSNTDPYSGGDYHQNEVVKPPQDLRDEEIAQDAAVAVENEVRHQGGTPIEGWQGQIIGEGSQEASEPADETTVAKAALWAEQELAKLLGE